MQATATLQTNRPACIVRPVRKSLVVQAVGRSKVRGLVWIVLERLIDHIVHRRK